MKYAKHDLDIRQIGSLLIAMLLTGFLYAQEQPSVSEREQPPVSEREQASPNRASELRRERVERDGQPAQRNLDVDVIVTERPQSSNPDTARRPQISLHDLIARDPASIQPPGPHPRDPRTATPPSAIQRSGRPPHPPQAHFDDKPQPQASVAELDRWMRSDSIQHLLALMKENMELKAQLKIQEVELGAKMEIQEIRTQQMREGAERQIHQAHALQREVEEQMQDMRMQREAMERQHAEAMESQEEARRIHARQDQEASQQRQRNEAVDVIRKLETSLAAAKREAAENAEQVGKLRQQLELLEARIRNENLPR